MAISKFRGYILLTGLGFIVAIAVVMLIFVQLRRMTGSYAELSQQTYIEQIEHLDTAVLSAMTEYIEKRYPVLHDTEYLKREAGTDRFWEIADEWHEIADIFNFAYIYYIEKKDDNYIFLLSSGIRRDEHPEWLGGKVWEGAVPAFIDEAWETRRQTVSPQPIVNEWGELLSAERPIITDGKVVGILGVDYDISYMTGHVEQGQLLLEQENVLIERIRGVLVVSVIVIIAFMAYQIWLSNTAVLVPAREAEADERTRLMLDATPMICTLWDAEGNLIDCNDEALKIFGLTKKPDFLEHFFSFCPEYQLNGESSRSVVPQRIRTVLETGSQRFEWMYQTGPGEALPVESTLVRVPWKNRWRVAAYARDLREIRETENKLRKALAGEIQYNKAKSDFLSRVSHELRTPLNAIIGIVSAAEKDGPNESYKKIRDASEHLLWLVNDILDMTSFDTGTFDFSSGPFSFAGAMRVVIDNIAQKAKARGQIFISDLDAGIPGSLVSDERRLKQVLLNLLNNAVKFTQEKGEIYFSAQMLQNDGNECTIRFEIIDNGRGIPPEALERIGEIFEQADNSITREHGGMGLGLSLTKRIVDLMHGQLRVESEPRKGSRFICDVRLGVAQGEAENLQNVDLNLTGKRVLIVDDVDINREILLAMLEDTGAVFHEASTGDEAVRMFLRNSYDLILMDLHMPVMDGYTATKNIRVSGQPQAQTIPIISISAESGADLHSKCLAAGISDHLAKPVDMETLFRTIAKMMGYL